MSNTGRKSVFLELAGRVYDRTGIATLGSRASEWYTRQNCRLHKGWLGGLVDDGYRRTGWICRWRMRGMRMRERSLLVFLRERAKVYLLESRAGDLGLWLLLSGVALLILSLIRGRGYTDAVSLYSCALLVLLSVPLMGCARPISRLLCESRLLKRLLWESCEILPDESGGAENGEARPLGVLIGGGISVLIGGIFSPLAVPLFLLLLPVTILFFAIPEIALLFTLAVLPFTFLTSHPTVLLCLFALFVHLSYALKAACGRRDFFLDAADVPVLLFCLFLAGGGLFGYGAPLEGLSLSLLALLYFPARHLLGARRWRRRACLVLMFGVLFCSLLGIYQYFFTDAVLQWTDAERFSEIGSRVTGVFDNPNVLGVYLLLHLPVALGLATAKGERGAVRLLSFVGVVAALLCAVLTWSRGAWLAILAELLLLLLLSDRRTASLMLLSPLLLPATLPLLPASVLHRFASIGSLADSSTRYRIYTWRGVLRMIGEHPFGIGVGESAFRTVYPRYAVSGIESVMHAHQMLLQLTAEMGLVGLLTFAAAILLLVVRGLGGRGTRGAAVALCGALVMGVFDHLWYAKGMIAILFVIASFTAEGEGNV